MTHVVQVLIELADLVGRTLLAHVRWLSRVTILLWRLMHANGCCHGVISTCLEFPLLILTIALRKMHLAVIHSFTFINALDLFLDGLLVCDGTAHDTINDVVSQLMQR